MPAAVAQVFFAIGQNYWGSGDTIAKAISELRKAGWHRHPSVSKKTIHIVALSCPRSDVTVTDGWELNLSWPEDAASIKWTQLL